MGVAHDHLRWNSGAMKRSVSAWGLLSARRIAVRVSSEASGPRAGLDRGGRIDPAGDPAAIWFETSRRCASPSIQAASSSAKPFGADGRHSGSPSMFCACMTGPISGGVTSAARSDATIHSPGRLSLRRGVSPGFRRGDERDRDFLEVAVGGDEALGELVGERGNRLVAHEMPHQLGRDVLGGRGMAGEHREHGAALIEFAVGVGLAEDRLRARLVHARIEDEHAAARLSRRHHGPAGDDGGEPGDIVLGVDGTHAQRMQLQDFAGEVLVEALAAIAAGDRIRADRARIVEIDRACRDGFPPPAACRRSGPPHAAGSPRAHRRRRWRAADPCPRKCRSDWTRTMPAARQSRCPQ